MKELLLINSNEKYKDPLLSLLSQCGLRQVELASSGSEVRRTPALQSCPMVILNTPLQDEFGLELAQFLTRQGGGLVLLLVKSEIAEEVALKAQRDGILVLTKPLNRPGFLQAVRLMIPCARRAQLLTAEIASLRLKLQQDKVISRAKCLLIERGFTEEQAHHFLEQQAMNQRTTRYEAARDICAEYSI